VKALVYASSANPIDNYKKLGIKISKNVGFKVVVQVRA
jgi:hypothetical protein